MRLGCCGSEDRLFAVQNAGYDYIEPPVRSLCPDLPEGAFEPVRRHFQEAGITPEAFNVFVPAELKIVGDSVDLQALAVHVDTALTRAAGLGGAVVVFGSGGARNAPEGFSLTTAFEQLVSFCTMAADAAARHDICIAIEPLSRKSCNTINTVAEAAELSQEVARPEIGVLADLYHLEVNADPWHSILEAAPLLKHVHLPVPSLDILTSKGQDFSHSVYLQTLKEAGYDGRISVEDNGKRFVNFETEARPVRDYLLELWNAIE